MSKRPARQGGKNDALIRSMNYYTHEHLRRCPTHRTSGAIHRTTSQTSSHQRVCIPVEQQQEWVHRHPWLEALVPASALGFACLAAASRWVASVTT
jgi:hypothetical protein